MQPPRSPTSRNDFRKGLWRALWTVPLAALVGWFAAGAAWDAWTTGELIVRLTRGSAPKLARLSGPHTFGFLWASVALTTMALLMLGYVAVTVVALLQVGTPRGRAAIEALAPARPNQRNLRLHPIIVVVVLALVVWFLLTMALRTLSFQ